MSKDNGKTHNENVNGNSNDNGNERRGKRKNEKHGKMNKSITGVDEPSNQSNPAGHLQVNANNTIISSIPIDN